MRALVLAVGLGAALAHAQPAAASEAPPAMAGVEQCLQRLRAQAPAHGVALADFDRHTRQASVLPATIAAARRQPEREEAWWDYIAKMVDDERVEQGRAHLAQSHDVLARIADRYGVDAEALVAIFGIETNYGAQLGKMRVLDAWLTRACTEGKPLWVRNVYAAVRLLAEGVVNEASFVGSWSGAFGMTQFIPTSFYELAADGDGDGRIDLYGSLADAYASTANHLRKRGARWTRGAPAVIEVRLPARLAATLPQAIQKPHLGDQRSTLGQWAGRGVTHAAGGALQPASARARLFAPTGARGPVFLVTDNFDAILRYNASPKYALAVGLLAERLRGGDPLITPWPTDDPGLSRAQIRELQGLLLARGHDIGEPDGIPGARTRDAAMLEQQRLGMRTDGRLGLRLLQALRARR